MRGIVILLEKAVMRPEAHTASKVRVPSPIVRVPGVWKGCQTRSFVFVVFQFISRTPVMPYKTSCLETFLFELKELNITNYLFIDNMYLFIYLPGYFLQFIFKETGPKERHV